MPDRVLNIAILGGGRMALKHAVAIRLTPNARLQAVVDPFVAPETLRERFGGDIQAFNSVDELLASARPDVVHIVTPPESHYDLARKCLEGGASVYVEKPFAASTAQARELLELAERKGLKACAAHQVLFQPVGRLYSKHLPMIGDLVHIESYFSFKPVRRRVGGSPMSAAEQLIDILPHPVYLLLSALEHGGGVPELVSVETIASGEVRALIRRGSTLASLVVTLRGRPVESYLRIVGMNGSVEADFVLGSLVTLPGPGASAPSVVLKPFSESIQKFTGSAGGLFRLLFKRSKSYPGLGELLDLFYTSVRNGGTAPTPPSAILQTVEICEQIAARLMAAHEAVEHQAAQALRAVEARLEPPAPEREAVFVTGGTGFLGKCVVQELRDRGHKVRVAARRPVLFSERVAGVEYVNADIGAEVPTSLLRGMDVVVHLAAETAGDKAAHERNTVVATQKLLRAMVDSGVRNLINIGSVAVMRPGSGGAAGLSEAAPVDRGNLGRGPYVWAKAEAEFLALEYAQRGELKVRTIRLGPLVDFSKFTPPGRLGREVARLFVAMGSRSSPLSVCDVRTAAKVIRHYVEAADCPPMLNLLEAPAPTRGELADRVRATRPDLRFLWLPFPVLRVLNGFAWLLQKALKPGGKPLDVYSAFAAERYDARLAQEVTKAASASQPVPGNRAQHPSAAA